MAATPERLPYLPRREGPSAAQTPGKNIRVCVHGILHPRFDRERESRHTPPETLPESSLSCLMQMFAIEAEAVLDAIRQLDYDDV